MKKIFLIGIAFMCAQQSFACEICGCSSGNYFIGPFPQFSKHFFGVRYSFRSFQTRLVADPTQFSNDFYQTIELWGGWNLGKKWQLLAFVPYNINHQSSDEGISNKSGLGDITLIANYNLLNKSREGRNTISQQLWLGAGIKLPTGKFSADAGEIVPAANSQPGSGSVDFLINAMYAIHINNWGINTSLNYKINEDADDYQFGNRFSANAFVFRSIRLDKVTLNPNVGFLFENLEANKLSKEKIEDTGGNALLAAAGLEIGFNKIAVGFNVQAPVSQNFSNDQTKTKLRGMLHCTFTF
jgi:hypothetical protein